MPTALLILAVFLLGASVGSFMDVVLSRRAWRASLSGRSRCAQCSVVLTWKALVPLFSYTALRGRCGSCSVRIPPQHLLSELLMGVLFVLAVFIPDSLQGSAIALVSSMFLVPIVLADFSTMEVPEHLSRPFAFLAFGFALALALSENSVLPILGGPLLAAPFYLLWRSSSGRAMGLGDAKLAFPLGFLLPTLSSTLSVFVFSFWIGTVGLLIYALYMRIRTGSFSVRRGMQMPLAPSIAAAFFLVFFTDISFFDITSLAQRFFI